MQPYYHDESAGITLYCGRAEDVLPTLPAGTVDLVFTSPPYNMGSSPWPHLGNWKPGDSAGGKSKWRNGSDASGGVTYESHDDDMPWPEYVAWQRSILSECWRTLTDTGAIFYNHKPRVIGAKLWLPLELNPGLPMRQIVIWARAGGMNFNPTAYVPTHEWIIVLAKEAFRLRTKAASGAGDVWYVPQEPNPHPAPFPPALPARAISTCAPRLVLDPFAGSGSTLRAAKDAGVRAIGIEKSERYCEMIVDRLRQEVLFAKAGARWA
jgi:site-specific DNA-methyltransferase (adenine-specific)